MPLPTDSSSLVVRHRAVASNVCVVTVGGEIDLALAPRLKAALNDLLVHGYRQFVLDLSAVAHLDSTGLGVLVGFQNRLDHPSMVAVACPTASVSRVFEVAGVCARLRRFSSVGEAVASLRELPVPGDCPPLTGDAALAVGLALTAVPFADSRVGEAECWLRVLSLHGDGLAMLCGPDDPPSWPEVTFEEERNSPATDGPEERSRRVIAHAGRVAADRDAAAVSAVDVLAGVMAVYGSSLHRVRSAAV